MTHATCGSNARRELDELDGIIDLLRAHLATPAAEVGDARCEQLYRAYYRIKPGHPVAANYLADWCRHHLRTQTEGPKA